MFRLPKEIHPRAIGGQRFAIYNGFNQFWTDETFATEREAEIYCAKYWGVGGRPREHRIVPVTLTISYAAPSEHGEGGDQ